MHFSSGAGIAGLVLDITGGVMLAVDFWVPHPKALDPPHDDRGLLIRVVEAVQAMPQDRGAALSRVHEACSAQAMYGTASAAIGAGEHARLRRVGWIGLFLVVLGFVGQLISAIGSAS